MPAWQATIISLFQQGWWNTSGCDNNMCHGNGFPLAANMPRQSTCRGER
jgi:hypothetical protein